MLCREDSARLPTHHTLFPHTFPSNPTSLLSRISQQANEARSHPVFQVYLTEQAPEAPASIRWDHICVQGHNRRHQGLISLYLFLIIVFLSGSVLSWEQWHLLMGLCGVDAECACVAPPVSEFHPDNWFWSVPWHLPLRHRVLLGPLFHFWVTKPLQASQAKAIVASLTFLIN